MAVLALGAVRVHYAEAGAGRPGPPVVLLHSGSNSGAQWGGVAARLAADFPVLAPDLYNCGETSPWPGPGPLTFDAEADLVAALVERAGGTAHLVGHSYGGGVALRLALTRPGSVRGLVLIEPPAYPLLAARDPDRHGEYAGTRDAFLAAAAAGDPAPAWRRFIDHYHGRAGAWEALSERARRSLAARTAAQVAVYQAQEGNPTTAADLARLGPETLVLYGETTTPAERAICDLIARAAPACRTAVIAGAGHMAPLTHPDAVARAIAGHLAGLAG
ncbi:MAG: alpha/beta hydrolase [Hyphomicrobiales bacterium]|nr:alpha/beta hydrolase [Hyphomicrobiales bacterium]